MRAALLALPLLALAAPAWGATYFVGQSGCRATGPGTQTQPWCSINNATGLAAGDTLVVLGGTYAEQVQIKASGGEGKPIVVQAADGAAPVIDGTGLKLTEEGLIDIKGQAHLVLRGLTVRSSPYHCVRVTGSRDVVVEKLTVAGCQHAGVVFDLGSSDVKALDNDVSGTDQCGQSCGNHEAITFSNVSRFVAARNRVHDGAKEGIDAKDGSADGEIYDNTVSKMGQVGIYLNHASWVRVYRNRVYDCQSTCIQLAVGDFALGPTETTNNRVFQNYGYRCKGNGLGFWKTIAGDMGQNAIYNNTFYGNSANGILLEDSPGNLVANNIVAGNGAEVNGAHVGAGIIGNTLGNIPISNNLFFKTGSTAGDGQVNADPRFVDADHGDFRLSSDSPAIDRGYDMGLDKVGQQDIGAYEYGLVPGEGPMDSGGCDAAGGASSSGCGAVLLLALLHARRRR